MVFKHSNFFGGCTQGHMDMLRSAQPVCPDKQPAFEISVQNADKGFTPKDQIEARLSQFLAAESPPCICTTCPLYVDKARLLPKSTFVIGERMLGVLGECLYRRTVHADCGCGQCIICSPFITLLQAVASYTLEL